ncbi:MAG TPA: hypothetical protein VIB79_23860 [Candidatus Binatia bacterium]|jgi:hypothetical protein
MPLKICIGAYILRYIDGGAYQWAFLNWALGLKSLGCRVIWLDSVASGTPLEQIQRDIAELKDRLRSFALEDSLAVIDRTGGRLPEAVTGCTDLDAALDADLFLNLGYDLDDTVVRSFPRSAFIDLDPGLTQTWISLGQLHVPEHDVYFTYGETVGRSEKIPTCGLEWHYTPPPVCLEHWHVSTPPAVRSSYTTVSNWWGDADWIEIAGDVVDNSKRTAFLEYLELPSRTKAQIELALPLSAGEHDNRDREVLERHGWTVRHVLNVSATPRAFQSYVQSSRGEFSCMKRGYTLLDTAWMSERSVNYLASGKPAVVQHTGPSSFLPDWEGLLRFRNVDEAARALNALEDDYTRHSKCARQLAEEYFDSQKVIPRVLEKTLA